MNNDTFICSECCQRFSIDDRTAFDEAELCPHCLHELTGHCSHCGTRIWLHENAGNPQTLLCQNCYDEHYTTCDRCGTLLRRHDVWRIEDDDDEEYCYDCFRSLQECSPIHDYFYKL